MWQNYRKSDMNKEQQDKNWEELNDELKNLYKEQYAKQNNTMLEYAVAILLEDHFGSHNLQPKIRTWEDVAIYEPKLWDFINKLGMEIANCPYIDSKLYKKLIATIHIQKLIELGYGGMVTDEEWRDDQKAKYVIKRTNSENPYLYYATVYDDFMFVAFHTPEQREEFMSYPENVELVKQYNLL